MDAARSTYESAEASVHVAPEATTAGDVRLVLTEIERVALDHAYDMFADIGADIPYARDQWRPSLANLDKALSWLTAARAMLAA